jgi:hypothetical protein
MSVKKSKKTEWPPWSDNPWVVATGILAAIATIAGAFLAWSERSRSPSREFIPASSTQPAQSGPDATGRHDVPQLPEDAARVRISAELSAGRIAAAIDLMSGLQAGPARDEECEHIFSFCIKNPSMDDALEKATGLANACWDGSARKEKLEAIALAKLKQR